MTRRTAHPAFCLAALAAAFVGQASAGPADRFADVEVTGAKVAGSVYMLTGAGGNIGASIGADGTLLVDDQYGPLAERINGALAELGGEQPRIILNTHFHGDHTGSNGYFGEAGTIIAHENVRIRLLDAEGMTRSGLPVVTYEDRLRIYFNDDEIDVLHLPAGHTDGDSIVWFRNAGVIHLGDHFFNGRFPFIDLASGGTVHGLLKNLQTVLAMMPEDIRIIPGHGPLGSVVDLAENVEMLESTLAAVERALAEGRSEAEIIAGGVDERWKDYAWQFIDEERWLQILVATATGDAERPGRR